ncbi:hypothetical protein BC332_08234 [Capsicum chinense]|nr:hypothetical protein BC332_08234 [Capsicum chinense]
MPLSLSCTDVHYAGVTGEQHELKKVEVTVEATAEEHNFTVDNPSTASKEEEKVEPVLAIVVLKEMRIRVYDSMSQRSSFVPSSEIKNWPKYFLLTLICMTFSIKRDYGLFVAAYVEFLRDGLQVPNDGLNARLLRKRYAAPLWKYGEAKGQKPYATDVKDPQRPKLNFVAPDKEQLVHID